MSAAGAGQGSAAARSTNRVEWLKRLVEPAPRLHDPDLRARARMLAALLLPFIPMLLTAPLWYGVGPLFQAFGFLMSFVVLSAYLCCRRGFYWAGVTLTLGCAVLAPFVLFFSRGEFTTASATGSLMYTALAISVAYLLVPLRGVIGVIVLLLGAVLLLPLHPDIMFTTVRQVVVFNLTVAVAGMIAALARQYNQTQYERQTRLITESERRYRELFTIPADGIVVHKGGRILDANPSFEQISGYSLDELIGMDVMRLFAPEVQDEVQRHMQFVDPYETIGLRKDGEKPIVEIRPKVTTYKGETVRVVAVRDITERKNYETRRMELMVEREKVRILQRFIGDMSHDIRTPLSVVKTSIYLIRKLHGQPDRQEQQLEQLSQQVDHLQHIFDDLLTMSRLDKADTTEYRFVWRDFDTLLKTIVSEQQTAALRKNQRLDYQALSALPQMLIEENEIRKLLKHLIENGMNYTPEGGSIHVTACVEAVPSTSVTLPIPLESVVIDITDTGMGIRQIDIPFIFERFYRADTARSTETGGTGLGLSIARKIAEAHGGTITVRSQEGHGSTFTVRLPVAVPPPGLHGVTRPELTTAPKGSPTL